MKKVIVIVGPTGSGKTKYSIALAKAINAEIINGDSVQVYKGLDIGSAKITNVEMENIPHHLFDIVAPSDQYSAYNFQKDVRKLIAKIDIPIIVGGTGFYIKSALYNYEFEKNDIAYDEYEHYSNLELYEQLKKLDPNITIDEHNKRRLISALIQAKTGNLRSEKQKGNELLYNSYIIYLDINRDDLELNLIKRLDKQLSDGFIDEVQALRNNNLKLNVIGYRELDQYLDGIYSLEAAKTEIIKVSKRLAKRQKTWFKNQMNVNMYNPLLTTTKDEIINDVVKFLKE